VKIIKNIFESAQLPFGFIDVPFPDQSTSQKKLNQSFIVNVLVSSLMKEKIRIRFFDHQFSCFLACEQVTHYSEQQ
jgi:hypothetical protein